MNFAFIALIFLLNRLNFITSGINGLDSGDYVAVLCANDVVYDYFYAIRLNRYYVPALNTHTHAQIEKQCHTIV